MDRIGFVKKFGRYLFISMFLSCFTVLSGQEPVDFSGTWVMDLTKSDANYKRFYSKMTCVIQQTPMSVKLEKTSVDRDGKSSTQEPLVYTLDGKVTSTEQDGGIDKYSSAWTPDKKKLNLKYVKTVNGSDYGSNESFSLSPDGKILTVTVTDLKGQTSITEIYNKK